MINGLPGLEPARALDIPAAGQKDRGLWGRECYHKRLHHASQLEEATSRMEAKMQVMS